VFERELHLFDRVFERELHLFDRVFERVQSWSPSHLLSALRRGQKTDFVDFVMTIPSFLTPDVLMEQVQLRTVLQVTEIMELLRRMWLLERPRGRIRYDVITIHQDSSPD